MGKRGNRDASRREKRKRERIISIRVNASSSRRLSIPRPPFFHKINSHISCPLLNNLFPLAFLSFLAVFREGTETVIFFIGMASSISLLQLLGGIGIGALLLLVIAYLILKAGMRIPLRPFFLLSSLLVFYLSLKFTGMGIRSLQLAGLLPATGVEAFPTIEFFSIYPTLEGLVPQALLLLFALFMVAWERYRGLMLRNKVGG